jgi:phospholipase C
MLIDLLLAVLLPRIAQTTAWAANTPIKHVVIIFQENQSFDHYFGTYPHAANPPNELAFHAAPDTPTVNGLTAGLLTHNPNLDRTFVNKNWKLFEWQEILFIFT